MTLGVKLAPLMPKDTQKPNMLLVSKRCGAQSQYNSTMPLPKEVRTSHEMSFSLSLSYAFHKSPKNTI